MAYQIAPRKAIGCGNTRLIRQLCMEHLKNAIVDKIKISDTVSVEPTEFKVIKTLNSKEEIANANAVRLHQMSPLSLDQEGTELKF